MGLFNSIAVIKRKKEMSKGMIAGKGFAGKGLISGKPRKNSSLMLAAKGLAVGLEKIGYTGAKGVVKLRKSFKRPKEIPVEQALKMDKKLFNKKK